MNSNVVRIAPFLLSAGAMLVLGGGCRREPIEVYSVAKETAAPAAPMPEGHGAMGGAPVQVDFKLPEGWKQKPATQMRAAQFTVPGPDGQDADVSVIPLPGMTAGREDLINIWREQLQLGPLSKEDAEKTVEKVAVAGATAELADMVSEKNLVNDRAKMRITVATLERDGTTWFIKMTGPDDLVKTTRPAFLEFLKGLNFKDAAAPAMAAMGMGAAEPAASKPVWEVPKDWQEGKPGPMQTAKFVVTGAGGKQAEITVSSLGGDGGGVLANANRWRGQLLLPPLSETDLAKEIQSVEVGAGKALMMDLKGTSAKSGEPARMVVVSVPGGDKTWFYKLLGDESVVEQQKNALLRFAGSAK